MLKLLGSPVAIFLGLTLVTLVEMDDHSQVHDWRYYALLGGFLVSALALVLSLVNMVRTKH